MTEAETGAPLPDTAFPALGAPTIQIVSPNVGIGPLLFSDLTLDTTVGQLKAKICDTLPTHPAGSQQRLIHRGRLLGRDNDTLRDIFPEDVVSKRAPSSVGVLKYPGANIYIRSSEPVTSRPSILSSGIPQTARSPPRHHRQQHIKPQARHPGTVRGLPLTTKLFTNTLPVVMWRLGACRALPLLPN